MGSRWFSGSLLGTASGWPLNSQSDEQRRHGDRPADMHNTAVSAVPTPLVRTGNDRTTPRYLLDAIEPIALDPCSNPWAETHAMVKCSAHDGQDGLAIDWADAAQDGLVFVNPPYGRGKLKTWAGKVADEALKGVQIAVLVPLDPTTEWFGIMAMVAEQVLLVDHRVQFGGGGKSNPRPSCILLFNYPERDWEKLGWLWYAGAAIGDEVEA